MSPARSVSRQRSRRAALQVLYALDLGHSAAPADAEHSFRAACAHFEYPEGARAFAKELIWGVRGELAGIDALIARHADHWRIERMAVVDRNVLRLAVYELHYTGRPPAVAIDEAVELARRFGGERSPAFVNGVLDAVARSLPPTILGQTP